MSSEPEPLIRARQLLSILEHVDKLPAQARQAVREAIAPAILTQVEASTGADWVPFTWDVELTHAIARALGPDGMHRFFQEQQLAAWRGPLLKSLVDSATALFGLDPGSWARWIPRGWAVVFRNCGRWEVERTGPGAVDLAFVAPPARALEDEVWLRSVASSFSSFLVLAKAEGEFALDHVDRARGAVYYRLRWRAG